MNIEGLDYNTQREKLVLPEYGREIQNMVDRAVEIPDKAERQRYAQTIIATMKRMVTRTMDNADYEHKLWDHLALMSGFRLDIDWPYDISQAKSISSKPEPMPYPMKDIPVRHYGSMLFDIFEQLKTMEPGKERDELTRRVANQMKHNLMTWSHGSADNEKIAADLAFFTDGKIQLDLNSFKFSKTEQKENDNRGKKKKR